MAATNHPRAVVVYVIGTTWAKCTPNPDRFKNKHAARVCRFLKFGQPFTIKEHVIATFLSSSSNNGTLAVNIFATERLFFDITRPAWMVILTIFSSIFCGLAVAGFLRSIVVYPSEMVYWGVLPAVTLFQKLHFGGASEVDKTAMKKFGWVASGTAIWQVIPTYIMPWLTAISIPCLATIGSPMETRKIVSAIFGGSTANQGLGVLSLSLDWNLIGSWNLSYPLKAQISLWIGIAMSVLILPLAYYTNTFEARKYPFLSHAMFLSNGTVFDSRKITDGKGIIDPAKLEVVGLPNLTASSILSIIGSNMAVGAIPLHIILFYYKDIIKSWKQYRTGTQTDPHYLAMRKYKEVPLWWYGAIFAATVVSGLAVNIWGGTTLPVGGYIVSLITAIVISPLLCFMTAIYGFFIIGSISDMMAGALYPSRPLASLYFANWNTSMMMLAVRLCYWLKLGQYTKIPHRVMLGIQMYGAILGVIVYYPLMLSIVENQREILRDPLGNRIWSGAWFQRDLASLVTWSMVKDMYGLGGKYPIVSISFGIGAMLPVIHFAMTKVFPATKKWQINTPFLAVACLRVPQGLAAGDWTGFGIGIFSQVYLRRYRPKIFNRYNYLIGAALDGGASITLFIMTIAVFGAFGKQYLFPTWWGNPQGPADHCVKTG